MTDPVPRPPAPEPLALVQRFVNTLDIEGGGEELADPAALRAWLREAGLLDPHATVDAAAMRRAIELREAIRELLLAHGGHAGDQSAHAVVNAAAARAQLRPVLHADGSSVLEPQAGGVDAALGRLVAAIHRASADGTWERLKACERDTCRWAYYDHSKNRSGRWCAMGVCGSREKSRRAYRRRRAAGADA